MNRKKGGTSLHRYQGKELSPDNVIGKQVETNAVQPNSSNKFKKISFNVRRGNRNS